MNAVDNIMFLEQGPRSCLKSRGAIALPALTPPAVHMKREETWEKYEAIKIEGFILTHLP